MVLKVQGKTGACILVTDLNLILNVLCVHGQRQIDILCQELVGRDQVPEVHVLKSRHNTDDILIVVVEVIHLSSSFVDLLSRFVVEQRLRPRFDLVPVIEAEDGVNDDVFVFIAEITTLGNGILHIKSAVDLTVDKVHAIKLLTRDESRNGCRGQQCFPGDIHRSSLIEGHHISSVHVHTLDGEGSVESSDVIK